MSEQEQIQAQNGGEELDEAQLEAVAGGGIIDDVVAAYDYVKEKINEAGQAIVNAANGGGQ